MSKNFLSLKILVEQYLGNRTDLVAWTGDWINMAIRRLERGSFMLSNGLSIYHNFRHMKTRRVVKLPAGTHSFVNPIQRYKEVISAFVIDGSGTRWPVERKDYSYCISKYPNLTNFIGRPVVFCELPIEDSLTLSRGVINDRMVASPAFNYMIANMVYSRDATESGLAVGVIPANKWALYLFSINSEKSITCTPAADNDIGYETEALALAAMPRVPDQHYTMGWVTVKTALNTAFVANIDALQGGTSGNPASETNYYVADHAPVTQLMVRPTTDTSYSFELYAYQYSADLDAVINKSNHWTEHNWELVLYGALLEAESFMVNDPRIGTWLTLWERSLLSLIKAEKNEMLSGSGHSIGSEISQSFNINYI